MTIDFNLVITLLDRFGTPLVVLGALVWLASLFVRGPAMQLARSLGDGFGALCKAGVGYLGEATAALRVLPSHVSLEAAGVRDTVKSEAAATRELVQRDGESTRTHVTAAFTATRDRVSVAENEMVRAVTGEHVAYGAAPSSKKDPS